LNPNPKKLVRGKGSIPNMQHHPVMEQVNGIGVKENK
jgi:hypothetical protein